MTNPLAPTKKKMKKMRKMRKFAPPPPLFHIPSSLSSFSSLPDEIVVSILARIPRSYYRSLCLVSKRFYSLLSSPEMYAVRSQIGATEPRLYICLYLASCKNHSWKTLREGFGVRIAPVRPSSSSAPARLNSTTVAVGFEIYQIGGTVGNKPSKAVHVLDCRSDTWRRAPGLSVARERAKSCFLDGKIYVIGGVKKPSKNWGEVFDVKIQTWEPFCSPSENVVVDRIHQVVVFEARLYVITEHNNYAYDPKQGSWLPPDVGLLGLGREPIITGPSCCIIENVIFADCGGEYKGYDSRSGVWLRIKNLGDLYRRRHHDYQTIHLVNHGGKLAIIWHQRLKMNPRFGLISSRYRKIMCMVIRLTFLGTQIFGEIENWKHVVSEVSNSYNYSLSVSL